MKTRRGTRRVTSRGHRQASTRGRVALIAGASGMVGRRLAEHVNGLSGWTAIGLARRPPADAAFPVVAVDLTDVRASRAALKDLTTVTDVFYTARFDHVAGTKEPIDANLAMLRNVIEAVEPVARNLRHVHLVHGTKYYGSHLGPFKTPARETDPRVPVENWYYAQEDCIIEHQRGRRWTWSASRPHGVCDLAPGIARSMARVIAVYAAIHRELGHPLFFPGKPGNFRAIYQCTDAALLARAIVWMASEPRCANQAFNVTNGDYIRWMNLWPVFAGYFGMEPGPLQTVRLSEAMADKAPVWERIVRRQGLVPTPYEHAALWSYGDFVFGSEYDMMSDTTKLRRYGFCEVADTEAMFLRLFDELRRVRIVP